MAKPKNLVDPILSHQILVARKANKLTQDELAEKIGVTGQTIRKYESGRYGIPKTSVKLLADALGCCLEYLYGKTNCFTSEEYQAEQLDIKNAIQSAREYLTVVDAKWKITSDLLDSFLGYKIKHTGMREEDGSFIPVVQITDANGRSYIFDHTKAAEDFFMCFYDDVKKVLRYHLLEHADRQSKADADGKT